MDPAKANGFAAALAELCKRHGVMIWTATPSMPIMASDTCGEEFHYTVEIPEFGHSVVIRRVLGDPAWWR
jgi:hypothetical protein